MTTRTGDQPDRRRHARVAPKGTVTVRCGGDALRGRIGDISHGGMFVVAATAARAVDQRVELEIRLDGKLAGWLPAKGHIVRVAADGFALAFDELPAGLLDAITEISSTSRTRHRTLTVVLIDEDAQRRTTMAEGFRSAGCTVIQAPTPLDAIHTLGESSFEPDLIAIADSIPSQVADELRTFVERDHPDTKLVMISDGIVEPEGVVNWLSSVDSKANLPSRVSEMLGRPRRKTRPL